MASRRTFGGRSLRSHEGEVRSARWETFVETCWRDFRTGACAPKSPAFTLIALSHSLSPWHQLRHLHCSERPALAASAVSEFRTSCARSAAFPEITFPATTSQKFFSGASIRAFESNEASRLLFSGVGVNLHGRGRAGSTFVPSVSARTSFRTLGVQPVARPQFTETKTPWRTDTVCQLRAWQGALEDTELSAALRLGGHCGPLSRIASKEFTFTPTADV